MALEPNKSLLVQTGVGFALLVAIVVGLGLTSVYALTGMYELSARTLRHPLVVSNAALEAEAGVARMHRSMKDVVLAESQEDLQTAVDAVEREERVVYKALDLVAHRILGERG